MRRLLDTVTLGRRRRYRRVMRRLRGRPPRRSLVVPAGVVSMVAAGALLTVVAVPTAYRQVRTLLPASQAASAPADLPRPENWPPAGAGASRHRLLPAVPAPQGRGGYRFENLQEDGRTPVAWDPCRPIRYVVHGTAPAGAQSVVAQAVAEIGAAAGMRFQYAGTTGEAPADDREPYQPGRYGERWAPVLIAWSDPAESPDLAGRTMGLGGAWRFPEPTTQGWGSQVYVSGSVLLDRPQFVRVLRSGRPDAVAVTRSVVVHELGHVLGLAHVRSKAQLMHPQTQPDITSLQAGDERGLAALGRAGCAPAL